MPSAPSRRVLVQTTVAAAALATAVTVGLTWPLFRQPRTTVLHAESLYGPAAVLIQRDINLTLWALAWDTHALTTRPAALFDANVFHPAPNTLALSEHMLGNVPLFGPVFLATGNPVLAHQVTLLATFAIAAATMAAYVLAWTGDPVSAVVAGLLYAVAPVRLWQIGSLHVISIHLLPLVLLAADRLLSGRSGLAPPLLLGFALALSTLCSYYVGYQAYVGLAVYAVGGTLTWRRTGGLVRLVVAAAAAALVVALVSLPYLRLQTAGGLPSYSGEHESLAFLVVLRHGVAGVLSFFLWSTRQGIPAFLTWTALTLTAVAVARRLRHPTGSLVAVALAGVVLALGPVVPVPGLGPVRFPYDWLERIVPGFAAMRVPLRFANCTALAVTALAGLGLARARGWLATGGWRALGFALPALVIATTWGEVDPGPLRARRMPLPGRLPPVVPWLAAHGEGGAVLHLPIVRHDRQLESEFMYLSIFHWLPIVNGYSSYPPPVYRDVLAAAEDLPAPDALARLIVRSRPRWVALHHPYLPAGQHESWERTLASALRVVGRFGGVTLYEVPPRR